MASTYRGDSPGKKLSRFRTWLAMMGKCRDLGIPYRGALALAGEGGDLSVLDGFGFPLESVTACDVDPDWLEYCAEVYPSVKTVHGEVGAIAEGVDFNMAHLDFCGGISAANIRTIADVCWSVKHLPSVIAVTMLKGREYLGAPDRGTLCGPVSRGVRRRHLAAAVKAKSSIGEYVLRSKEFDPRHVLKLAEQDLRRTVPRTDCDAAYNKNGSLTSIGKALIRARAIQACVEYTSALRGAFPGDGPCLSMCGVLGYHSRSKKAHGTPFCTAIFVVHHAKQREAVCDILLNGPSVAPFHVLNTKQSMDLLRPTAAEMARVVSPDKVAKMFDVNPSSVVAWKAHATRGTYKEKPLIRLAMTNEPNMKGAFVFRPVQVGRVV